MKIKWIHFGLVALVATSISAFGQIGRVGGTVVDAEGNPVEGAQIEIQGLKVKRNYKLETNAKGKYMHMGIFAQGRARYRVVVRMEGYRPDFIEGIRPVGDIGGGDVDFKLVPGNHTEKLVFELSDEERAALKARQAKAPESKGAGPGLVEKYEAGVAAINAGNYQEAVTLLQAANNMDGSQPAIWSTLAKAYEGLKDYDSSLEAYENAVMLEPNVAIYQNMGNMWAAKQDMEKANEYYEKAVALATESDPTAAGTTYYNMAVNHINSGNYKAAVPILLKAVEADPDHAEAHYQLGIVLLGMNRIPEAVEHLKRYVELDPSSENAVTAQALVDELG